MAMTSAIQILTLEEFLALPEEAPDGSHYELSEGELITLSPSGHRHGVILANIAHLLRSALDRSKYVVAGGEAGFLLRAAKERATVRGADVAVTKRSASVPVGLFPGAPFVAIEVVSPTNTAEDLERKIQQYLSAGSQEVWVVYPETKHVHLYSAEQSGPVILSEEGTLSSAALNTQFQISQFFEL